MKPIELIHMENISIRIEIYFVLNIAVVKFIVNL